MKSIVITTIWVASLALGACAADTSPSSSQPGDQPAAQSADVVSSGISKIKTLQSAPLEAVRAKFLAGASSFPADGYDARRLQISAAASANVVASLNKHNKHLKGTAEIATSGITTPAQATQLVAQLLEILELDSIDNAEKKAFADALSAALFVNGKLSMRVFTGSDEENLTHNVFLVDDAHHEVLELNEGS